MKKLIVITVALPVMTILACRKSEPPPPTPAATAADKRVAAATETFSPKDTIYASVETAGTGHAKLRARWSFVKGDKTAKVDETTIEFDSAGPAVNEFHISKPSGWPKGDYRIDVFLGDAESPAATRTFKVI